MRRLSEVRETWKTAFADPLCARTAACRDRDKPANFYSDRGGKWRSLNPASVFSAAQLHRHSRLICRLEAKNYSKVSSCLRPKSSFGG
jgi:hypothetical protein